LGLNPSTSVYIGDAERDIEAARRAEMPSLVAAYGYLHPSEQPQTWGADGILQSPLDLLDWLNLSADLI
jgi:phosphoglycolate phosphatase